MKEAAGRLCLLYNYIYTSAYLAVSLLYSESHSFTKLLSVGQFWIHHKYLSIFGMNECQQQLTLKAKRYLIPHHGVETEPDMLIYLLQLINILMFRKISEG